MNAIVPLKRSGLDISIDPGFFTARDNALSCGSLVLSVSDASQMEFASKTAETLAELRRGVEKARKELKEPFLQAGKDIDARAKEAQAGIAEEESRLSRLCGDYQALVNARLRSMEAIASNPEISAEDRAFHEAIANAVTLDEVDRIRESRPAGSAPITADSVSIVAGAPKVKTDWDITVTDIHALYRSHPNCVKLEPIISAIKEVLNAGSGSILKGVTFKKVNKV